MIKQRLRVTIEEGAEPVLEVIGGKGTSCKEFARPLLDELGLDLDKLPIRAKPEMAMRTTSESQKDSETA